MAAQHVTLSFLLDWMGFDRLPCRREILVGFWDDRLKRVVFSKKNFLDPTGIRKGTHQNRPPTDPPFCVVSVFYDSEFRNHFGGESGISCGSCSCRGMLGSS